MNGPRLRSLLVSVSTTAAAAGLAALAGPGCGDGLLCQNDVLVIIQSPSGTLGTDSDQVTAGVQTDVRVRTTLLVGTSIGLTVTDSTGFTVDEAGAVVDADGYALFADVTVPSGTATLRAEADAGECGVGVDQIELEVLAATGCDLTLRQPPEANDYYAPLRVLGAGADPDPATPGFQATIDVASTAGFAVELFRNDGGGDVSLGVITANPDGQITALATLPDGTQSLRAVCTSPGGGVQRQSATAALYVDTMAPTCALVAPAPGTTITPALDGDADASNGLQLTLVGAATGTGDVLGEASSFELTPAGGTTVTVSGSLLDVAGQGQAVATLDRAGAPDDATVVFSARDHAGNTCRAEATYPVRTDGCAIVVEAPTGPVTGDADGNPGNGVQVDVTVTVEPACAGRPVTSDCGLNNPSGVAPASGPLMLRVDACGAGVCEVSEACTFAVSTTDGIQTTAGLSLVFDNQAPVVDLVPINPAVPCGGQITPAQDQVGNLPGVQIRLRMYTPPAVVGREVVLTNASGTAVLPVTSVAGDIFPTVVGGANTLVGRASDVHGNLGQDAPCTITLADLAVSFSPPAADGIVGPGDGTVSAGRLAFPLCGTVSATGASVGVVIDGGPAQSATVTGQTWCVPVNLAASPPVHTVVASATAGASLGSASLALTVDLTPPPPISGLTAVAETRQSIALSWTSPSDGGRPVAAYVAKLATSPLTSANFNNTGTVLPTGLPLAPGTAERLVAEKLDAGTAYYLGLATIDAAGIRSTVTAVGPIVPRFTQTGALTAPTSTGDVGLGARLAHGLFNDDDFGDVAVAAPGADGGAGAVYVYFGSSAGISDSPGLTLSGPGAGAAFGAGLTALRWSSASRDDLVVGAPGGDAGRGQVLVWSGGAAFPVGAADASSAPLVLGVDAGAPGWFAGAGLGANLTRIRFDDDGVDDLAIAAPGGGGGASGVVLVYGGTLGPSPVLLSSVTSAGSGTTVVELFVDPVGSAATVGAALVDVGPTASAGDVSSDLLIGYSDDGAANNDLLYLLRGGARPGSAGVHARTLGAADLTLRYTVADSSTDFGQTAAGVGDVDGDGVGDVAVGAWRFGADRGQVFVVRGGLTGDREITAGGTALTTFTGSTDGAALGAAVAAGAGDVDADGQPDLLVVGRAAGVARLFVWFGGAVPTGSSSEASADYVVLGPASFALATPGAGGPPAQARWIGDVNRDGLADVCWASPADSGGDGGFEVLWDDGP
jgi:hypothetical protein